MNQSTGTGKEAFERLSAYVREQIEAGADRGSIKMKLMAGGLKEEVAAGVVDRVFEGEALQDGADACPPSAIAPALLGGMTAAALGGLAWGLIVRYTGYEIGWVAWGIGLAAGYGVLLSAKGHRGMPLQLIAVAAAILGIAAGKYLTFFYSLKEYVAEEYGAEAVVELSMFSAGVLQFFVESLGVSVSGFDALWILLAVGTAWGIPKARSMMPATARSD